MKEQQEELGGRLGEWLVGLLFHPPLSSSCNRMLIKISFLGSQIMLILLPRSERGYRLYLEFSNHTVAPPPH